MTFIAYKYANVNTIGAKRGIKIKCDFSFEIHSSLQFVVDFIRSNMFLRAVPSALSNVVQSSRRFFSRLRAVEEYVILESESKEKFKINCLHTGSGPNALILLPGALGTIHTDFQPQLDALPTLLDNYTIIAWDPPGYGKSRPPERTFPPGFYHRDAYLADALMRRLGFDKYSVAGWSDGGSTGLVMASRYPEVIQKLIIWGAGSYVCPTELEFCESELNFFI